LFNRKSESKGQHGRPDELDIHKQFSARQLEALKFGTCPQGSPVVPRICLIPTRKRGAK
jgi:hypothetical protein